MTFIAERLGGAADDGATAAAERFSIFGEGVPGDVGEITGPGAGFAVTKPESECRDDD